jgi:hypothetical protein
VLRPGIAAAAAAAIGVTGAGGQPAQVGRLAATENPVLTQVPGAMRAVTYGLCIAPQNADAFASSPVPVLEDQCSYHQRFEATSAGPSHGSSCGGFTVAFGPLGDLKRDAPWSRYEVRASWGDTPLGQAECAAARISAVAWGARCSTPECPEATWEKLGGPQSKKGTWQPGGKACALELVFFGKPESIYKTINVDVITTLAQGGQTTRKRAFASIRASRGNGNCASTTHTPPSAYTPMVPASTVRVDKKL